MPDVSPGPDADRPDKRPRHRLIDGSFLFLIAFAVCAAVACYVVRGPDVAWETMVTDARLMAMILPTTLGGILLASFLQYLTPVDLIRRHLGTDAGLRGMLTVLPFGLLIPGGPMVSMPLIRAMILLGADLGACAAFFLSWSLLGVSRVLVWEVPLLGAEFSILRLLVSLPLPILTGVAVALMLRNRPSEKAD